MKIADYINTNRKVVTYLVLFLWISEIIVAIYTENSLKELSVNFLSLTGFISSYLWSETKRPSGKTVNLINPSSSRMKILYITITLWVISVNLFMFYKLSLLDLAAYYGALTPFIGGYLISVGFKSNKDATNENNKEII